MDGIPATPWRRLKDCIVSDKPTRVLVEVCESQMTSGEGIELLDHIVMCVNSYDASRRNSDIEHALNCAKEVIDGYEFKFTNVLDSGRRCVHNTNRVALHQLDRALRSLEE